MRLIFSVNILYTISSGYDGSISGSSVSGFAVSIPAPHNLFLTVSILLLFLFSFINIYTDITPETADDTSLTDCSFCQQMRSNRPAHRGQHQIVQEDEEEKEEEDVTHPTEFEQFREMDAKSCLGTVTSHLSK